MLTVFLQLARTNQPTCAIYSLLLVNAQIDLCDETTIMLESGTWQTACN